MAYMGCPGILCFHHEKAWHQAPAGTWALTQPPLTRLGGAGRNRLRGAAALTALATRGQQAPTGSPPRDSGQDCRAACASNQI